jgi:predicted kinase
MLTVTLTKGLPGSGKSTWAKQIIDENPSFFKRINKDDLRAMLDNGKFSSSNEKFILKIRDSLILMALDDGKHVIIDDTNLHPKHTERIKELINGKARLVIKDFTDVPLDVCIERDLKRTNSVGEKVIRSMYNKFLKIDEVYNEDLSLPKAIIVDIDGTLAKMNNRDPYEWDKVKQDYCNTVVKKIVNSYDGNVIVVSGRDGICKNDTIEWLNDNEIKYNELYMRDEGNAEKDSIIKKRIFEENIRGKYFIEYVLDDRNQVVEMWRSLGLTCLQVADGDF